MQMKILDINTTIKKINKKPKNHTLNLQYFMLYP